MRRGIPLGLLTAVALGVASAAPAEIYRWTDAQGRIHTAQDLARVPPEHRAAAGARAAAPGRFQTYSTPAAPERARRAGGTLRIPFEKHGNAMLVQVRVNGRVTAPFLVDTGATDVAIPAWVASQAGVSVGPETPRATYQTANGLVTKPVVLIDSLEVGEARLERVRASISDAMEVGLLGGTFFNNFTFQVDPAAHLITLRPNDGVRGGLSEQQWRQRFGELRGRLAQLEDYMTRNHFTRAGRVADLERHRAVLEQEIEALEAEADGSDVPQAWRE